MQKTDLRGVFFSVGSFVDVYNNVLSRLANDKKTVVYTPNSEIMQMCIENDEVKDIINSADITIPDGIGVIKAAKILNKPLHEKIAGVELGERIISTLPPSESLYILGGKPGVAAIAAEKLKTKYPSLNVCGFHDGYFNKENTENNEVVDDINSCGATVLLVCLGAPAQETWIYNNKLQLPCVKLFMGLGGSVDIYSETVKRAPRLFCKFGLEWLYRLLTNPKRIVRMMNLPKFYFGTVLYKFKSKT